MYIHLHLALSELVLINW